MLFNSYGFLFVFLPVVAIGCWAAAALGRRTAIAWLVAASLVFYGYWNPRYLALLAVSIVLNYGLGRALAKSTSGSPARVGWLVLGLAANLGILGYYKYANFFVETAGRVAGTSWHIEGIILPLAISFFTFQQMAYLVDTFQGRTRPHDFWEYCLFVAFFPQLIAGPIVHHGEVLPQFRVPGFGRLTSRNVAAGLTLFVLGLFKKVVLADNLAEYANPVFGDAQAGLALSTPDAWIAALAYTLQLYFDFSGYSDMAIGLGRMFGVRLPVNFNSPYKATSIIDFWRRWHITLSRFLRDYLYIPLGGSRHGGPRRYMNLGVTMLLGGLWHGAGWTFVFWGALHGAYLMINHAWHALVPACASTESASTARRAQIVAGRLITLLAVVVGWVFFRAESFSAAGNMLAAMSGWGETAWTARHGWEAGLGMIVALLAVVWFAPNTQELMSTFDTPPDPSAAARRPLRRFAPQPTPAAAAVVGLLAVVAVLNLNKVAEFLYFQF